MAMAKEGKFITFEGGDGTGKTTQIDRLCLWLEKHKDFSPKIVVKTKEPSDDVKRQLDNRLPPFVQAKLIIEDRKKHLQELIFPQLQKGCWVICDRYIDSTYAYQGEGEGLGEAVINQLHQNIIGQVRMPDLTFLFDCDVGYAQKRMKLRGIRTDFDKNPESYQQKLRMCFLQRAQKSPERFCKIDASLSIEDVSAILREEVKQRFF